MEHINSKDNLIRLIDQYQNLVFSVCLKMTGDYFAAEDLTQETFLSAYTHMHEFDGMAEKAWLCRIASNKCIDFHRAAARRMIPTAEEELPETEEYRNEPLETALNHEVMNELEQSCLTLSPPYREVALMHFLEGKSAKEISIISQTGIHTVQTRIYRAREKLQQIYRKEKPK